MGEEAMMPPSAMRVIRTFAEQIDLARAERDALLAEVERLRAALTEIASAEWVAMPRNEYAAAMRMRDFARAALAQATVNADSANPEEETPCP